MAKGDDIQEKLIDFAVKIIKLTSNYLKPRLENTLPVKS